MIDTVEYEEDLFKDTDELGPYEPEDLDLDISLKMISPNVPMPEKSNHPFDQVETNATARSNSESIFAKNFNLFLERALFYNYIGK